MANAVIAYDKDLPEIPDRRPWERPNSYLVKDDTASTGWREDKSSRRASDCCSCRRSGRRWTLAKARLPGASDVTRRLFEYWFHEDHEVAGSPLPFRYYFCQREAIETFI